jgi:hypothetical protein
MKMKRYIALTGLLFNISFMGITQRTYTSNSVLSSGTWYKIAVKAPGVYKIDIPFLNNLGISTNNLASGSIRVYGNGGQMLAEANASIWIDDLKEDAISVVDGGDGIINGADYILFYANGPDDWVKDSVNSRFNHRKNITAINLIIFYRLEEQEKELQRRPIIFHQTSVSILFQRDIFMNWIQLIFWPVVKNGMEKNFLMHRVKH